MASVFLNGVSREVDAESLSYDDIVEMAGYPADMVLTVTVDRKGCGSFLFKGRTIAIDDGMIFNVDNTSNA